MRDYWEKMIIEQKEVNHKDLLNDAGEYNTQRLRDQGFNEDEVRLRTGATYYIHRSLSLISLRKVNLPEWLLETKMDSDYSDYSDHEWKVASTSMFQLL